MATAAALPIGARLREWRLRRHLSQLALAVEANISTRHLSFIETGRSVPSREMVLHLAEQLDVPLRERNGLLTAAGYAPVFPERALSDPALVAARKAIDHLLAAHAPYPAIAVDRHWTLVTANAPAARLMAGIDASLLTPEINVLRVSLHPLGLAPRIVNLAEWRAHLLMRLRKQIDVSADTALVALFEELAAYPAPAAEPDHGSAQDYADVIVPLQLRVEDRVLSFLSTTTIFGTPVDVTLSELALETFFPANGETAEALRAAADDQAAPKRTA